MQFAYVDTNGRVVTAHNDETVSRLPDGAVLLEDEAFENRFSLRWDGAVWVRDEAEAEVTPESPMTLQASRFQFLAALLELDELDAVMAWGAADASPLHKLALETSPVFSTSSETIAALAAARGWTDDYVVQLFKRAALARA